MRLQFGVTSGLIAVAIVVLLLTGGDAREGASVTGGASPQPNATATTGAPAPDPTPLPEPTASPWLRSPEWVAVASLDELPYIEPAIVEIGSGRIWSFTAPGVAPIGQPSDVSVHFLGWTPEGEALVRVSGGERANIYVALPGQAFVPWTGATGSGDVRYSPDGRLVAVDHQIFDPSSGEVVVTLPPGALIGWSADSRYFAVSGDREEPRIIIWDRESGELRELFRASTGVWSSNGSLLAYLTNPQRGTDVHPNEILVQDIASGEIVLSTTISALSAWPVAWSRDDEYLVASVTRRAEDGTFAALNQAHIIDLGRGIVTVEIMGAKPERWLSTGAALLLSGNYCSAFDIFTVAADGTALTNHTETEAWELYQVLSPSSEFVAFTSSGGGERSVNTLSLATGRVSPIVIGDDMSLWRVDPALVWSPDGEYLVFSIELGHGICEGSERQETAVKILQ